MKQLARAVTVIGVIVASANGAARADVLLSGPDSNDGSYSAAALSQLATGGDTVSAGGYTGISVWGLLRGANASSPTSPIYGGITTSTPAGDNGKNAILHYYLVASNGSGAQSVVSLGEIDPRFGGTAASPPFIAYQATGGSLLGAPDLIVPGAPGRDVSNVTSLQLLAVPALPAGGGGPSTSVQLAGNVTQPGSYTLTMLETDFTPAVETVANDTYTGVPLWTFLGANNADVTDQIVVAEGTDGYEAVLSLAELDPSLGGNPNDLLPYGDSTGQFPADGVARVLFPTDNAQGRWVSNLDLLQVETVPEPGSLALLAAGIVGLTIACRSLPARRSIAVGARPSRQTEMAG